MFKYRKKACFTNMGGDYNNKTIYDVIIYH